MKKKTKLELAQEKMENTIEQTNIKIDVLGMYAGWLYAKLDCIQLQFDAIRNVPTEKRIQYENLKEVRLTWKQEADKIEADFKDAAVMNVGKAAAGVGAGVAVAALGPTAAMGIATTFGVASTGTAISSLCGAAATKAALAWLGGGALAAGGGGMAAGEAFLAMAGPVGWAIAAISLLGSGFFILKANSEKDRLEEVFTLISERDTKSYELAIVELNERIERIKKDHDLLSEAIRRIQTFGADYNKMSESQQYALGTYVNLMEAATQLLVNPIVGLLPKYSESDYDEYTSDGAYYEHFRNAIITFSNLFYKIDLDKKDKELLARSFRKNNDFLSAIEVKKDEINVDLFDSVDKCLNYKYAQKVVYGT